MNPNNNKSNFTQAEQDLINGGKTDLKRPKSPHQQTGNGDRVAQSMAQAAVSTDRDKTALAAAASNQLAGMQASLEKIADNRTQAIEKVSDTLAYLYSPQTFQADVMRRTAEKLSGGIDAGNPLDLLSDTFAVFDVDYPAISPSTACGALPM